MRVDNSLATYVLYWATILSACTMGETAGDYLSFGLKLGYARSAIILGVFLLLALLLEWRAKAQSEYRYWATIIIMSTTGTALADFITRTLELGYARGSALLITIFILIYFAEWAYRRREGGGSKGERQNVFADVERDIKTRGLPKTDAFYWLSILVASTFGTTMGDFTSDVLGLGFGGGALLLAALLLVILVVDYFSHVGEIALYWAALVVASTIGATTGDFLTKPDALNLGYAIGSLILITVLAVIFFIRYKLAPTKSALS